MSKKATAHDEPANKLPMFAFDFVMEEMNALYALANAALNELEPPEGTAAIDSEKFFAYQLVRLMHDRLERIEFRNNLRQVLMECTSRSTQVPAAAFATAGRAAA